MNGKFTPSKAFRPPFLIPGSHARPSRTELEPARALESPLDCKEIQSVHPKGDQSWVFIGGTDAKAETPIFWPPHAKS